MKSKAKIAVIGAGFVGTTIAYTLVLGNIPVEIALIDINEEKASGEALDIMHGSGFLKSSSVYAGDYKDLKDTDIIIITAGVNQKVGETRLNLLKRNASIFKTIIENIKKYADNPIIIVVTNPVDILTYLTYTISGMERNRIIGSGTVLDSSRLKWLIGKETGITPQSIHAYIIGEHGDSEVPAWSRTSIAGINLEEYCGQTGTCSPNFKTAISLKVRNAAYDVIQKKGTTYYGIALSVRRIVESILGDEHSVLTVSGIPDGEHGISGIAISLPAIIGKNGIEKILQIPYAEEELKSLIKSADTLKASLENLKNQK